MDLSHYSQWLRRLGWLLGWYSFCRLLFYVFNYQQFNQSTTSQLFFSFGFGLKFDLASIAIFNMVFTLFSLLPVAWVNKSWYQTTLKWFFCLTNLPMLWLNVADVKYYQFIGRRTNFEVFSILSDIQDQASHLAGYYWYLVVIIVLMSVAFVRYLPSLQAAPVGQQSSPSVLVGFGKLVAVLFLLGLSILIFRGGFQEKPLRINQAFVLNDSGLGNLALNSTFTFLTTMDAIGTQRVRYFEDKTDLKQLIHRDTSLTGFVHKHPQNVVIFILESFGREYMGYQNPWKGYTPFLDSLAKAGVCFTNHFANGRTSIDAVPSVLASVPSLMDEPYITCTYQSNRLNGLGSVVAAHGYATSFFHGARNGSMGFEGFSQIAGFQRYFGLNQYPKVLKEKDFDGQWGIMDGPFEQFFAKQLTTEQKPFLSSLFTLSSHHPYTIPEDLKGKFPKGKAEIHESIGYADYSLRKFFETAKQQDWYQNTLFVFTADHTQHHIEKEYSGQLGAYRIPLILFHPDADEMGAIRKHANALKIVQQADIMPTVLDYLNIQIAQPLPFGQSVFSKSKGTAFHYYEGIYRLIRPGMLLVFKDGNETYYRLDENMEVGRQVGIDSVDKQMATYLKALIQFHHNGLIDNKWVK
ncbi:MAG: sulfatase-like hydrolase/transferase [Spirosomataceae bacterium]